MTSTKKTSDQETIWAIRDARTLNRNQKFFLMTVASRGVYRRSAKNAYAEMDMSRTLWEKTRDSSHCNIGGDSGRRYPPIV